MSDDIRSIFDRWQHLEEEKARISEDLKELFGEAKSRGYQTKELRIAFREKVRSEDSEAIAKDEESRAIVDTYLSALGTPTRAHPAGARTREAA